MTDDIQSMEVSGYLCTLTSAGLVGIESSRNIYVPTACGFAHCEVVLFFISHHAVDQDLWGELGACESFLHEFLTDGLDCRPLPSGCHRPLTSLLPELTHGMRLPSWIVR